MFFIINYIDKLSNVKHLLLRKPDVLKSSRKGLDLQLVYL